jgi:type VI secretion system VasD/TssJ family lipoprotein
MRCLAILTLLTMILAGCSSTGTPTKFTLATTPTINPDGAGQPQPVEVWLYELKSPEDFSNASFYELYQHPDNTLDNTVLGLARLTLHPDEVLHISRLLAPDTRYLGVLVGYRDITRSHWRQLVAVDPDGKQRFHIDIDKDQVQAGPGPSMRAGHDGDENYAIPLFHLFGQD